MGVKFKCRQTGNVFEFESEFDIAAVRKQSDYEEVKEEVKPVEPVKKEKK